MIDDSMHSLHVVGARPNLMKVACGALSSDANMSNVFLRQLEIPAPDANSRAGSEALPSQTPEVMARFERSLWNADQIWSWCTEM
jgi:hypothetical protein